MTGGAPISGHAPRTGRVLSLGCFVSRGGRGGGSVGLAACSTLGWNSRQDSNDSMVSRTRQALSRICPHDKHYWLTMSLGSGHEGARRDTWEVGIW